MLRAKFVVAPYLLMCVLSSVLLTITFMDVVILVCLYCIDQSFETFYTAWFILVCKRRIRFELSKTS